MAPMPFLHYRLVPGVLSLYSVLWLCYKQVIKTRHMMFIQHIKGQLILSFDSPRRLFKFGGMTGLTFIHLFSLLVITPWGLLGRRVRESLSYISFLHPPQFSLLSPPMPMLPKGTSFGKMDFAPVGTGMLKELSPRGQAGRPCSFSTVSQHCLIPSSLTHMLFLLPWYHGHSSQGTSNPGRRTSRGGF